MSISVIFLLHGESVGVRDSPADIDKTKIDIDIDKTDDSKLRSGESPAPTGQLQTHQLVANVSE